MRREKAGSQQVLWTAASDQVHKWLTREVLDHSMVKQLQLEYREIYAYC